MSRKPVFLLQNNYFDQIGRLIEPCLEFCRKHEYQFVDRSLTDTFDPDKIGIEWSGVPGVVVFGSVGWIKRCAKSTLSEWVFYNNERFAATSWAPILGKDALNGDGQVQTIKAVTEGLEHGLRAHIRPNADDKAFNGGVYDIVSWHAMLDGRRERRQALPEPNLKCWVSAVKKISAEYRCWFIDGHLVNVSMYRNAGEKSLKREVSNKVYMAAETLAARHLPIENIVMDIAETAEGFQVIEFNPINSSGWYAASTEVILEKWCQSVEKKAAFEMRPKA